MINKCPVCSGRNLTSVLDLEKLPVAINAQASPEKSNSVAKGNMSLVVCEDCTHLFNMAFDIKLSHYDSSYENSLHYSEHFRNHARSLAQRLVANHGLTGETVAEAGAGPGHFLELLCEEGVKRAYGFDPSYDANRLGAPEHSGVTLSNELFPSDCQFEVKMAMSQHVLEHLTDPVELLKILKASLSKSNDGVVYSEVPNGDLMIEKCALWDLIYEHFSFFTQRSLTTALNLAGLSVTSTGTDFGDQFLWAVATADDQQSGKQTDKSSTEQAVEAAVNFGKKAKQQIEIAKNNLEMYKNKGPVALWGAGSKGMTYLNLVADNNQISTVVDVNPRKTGYGVPGTEYTIYTPTELAKTNPKTVLIANPIYKGEIEDTLNSLGVKSLVLPLWT